MNAISCILRLFLLLLILMQSLVPPTAFASSRTLSEQVKSVDKIYSYRVNKTWIKDDVQFAHLQLRSQRFNGTIWTHNLTVATPRHLRSSSEAILLISGGRSDRVNQSPVASLAELARRSGMIAAAVEQVPNQPLFKGKLEDEIIAFTLSKYFVTGDEGWPLLVPMVRSAVRAMDAVQDFVDKKFNAKISNFTLTGESKRAWTTWLTAAVDSRVNGLVPMVFDMLNIPAQLRHQQEVWGGLSEELGDYAKDGLPALLPTPRGQELLQLIDPYSYRSKLTMPKLIVLGTNDRYWPVDAAQLYLPGLSGSTYLYYAINSGHEVGTDPGILDARIAMAQAAAGLIKLPSVTYQFTLNQTSGSGSLFSDSGDLIPIASTLWVATSPSRDFRQAKWEAQPVDGNSQLANKQSYTLPGEERLFTGLFLTSTYQIRGVTFKLSSPVYFLPPSQQVGGLRNGSEPGQLVPLSQ